jgi:hypothetical protein
MAAGIKAGINYLFPGDEEDKKKQQQMQPRPAPAGPMPTYSNPYLNPDLPLPTPMGSGTAAPMESGTAAPPAQQIPAGAVPVNNTTLLQRMMRSREYA